MYLQEQMIKNKRDIPKEEVQSERSVGFFKSEINNLLCISVSSDGLGLGAGVYTLTNKIEKRAQMQAYIKNGNLTYD